MRGIRHALSVRPIYKTVDTCAGEFPALTPYHYSSYDAETEVQPSDRTKVVIIGSGVGGGSVARQLAGSGLRILILERGDFLPDEPQNADAEAVFEQLQDTRVKTILSVNAQGRVREYRLQLDYRFRVVNAKGQELVGPNEINLSRDITYDDSTVLAKDLEEGLLWRDMSNDLVNQIIRRLSIIKPKNPGLEEDD